MPRRTKLRDAYLSGAVQDYYDYLDALYARHKLAGRLAVLAELVPLLDTQERAALTGMMLAAGYTWRGLTD